MGISKTEVKLRRLLAALPQQTNQVKLKHYLATLREQLLILSGEDGQHLPSISGARTKEYSDCIQALAEKLMLNRPVDIWDSLRSADGESDMASIAVDGPGSRQAPAGGPPAPSQVDSASLRKRNLSKLREAKKETSLVSEENQKLDAETHKVLAKHRQLQEDLTDEMVLLARQIKETSLMMDHSLRDTEKVLDSTERAVEFSLTATNQANLKAGDIYARSFYTSCITWLIVFFMFSMFMFMVLLIRLT